MLAFMIIEYFSVYGVIWAKLQSCRASTHNESSPTVVFAVHVKPLPERCERRPGRQGSCLRLHLCFDAHALERELCTTVDQHFDLVRWP